jgi:hypothetical protein
MYVRRRLSVAVLLMFIIAAAVMLVPGCDRLDGAEQ